MNYWFAKQKMNQFYQEEYHRMKVGTRLQPSLARKNKIEENLTPQRVLDMITSPRAAQYMRNSVRLQEWTQQRVDQVLNTHPSVQFSLSLAFAVEMVGNVQVPRVQVKVQVRPNPPRGRRKDKRSHANRAYLRLMIFLNLTYGTVTEVIDFYQAFADNFYIRTKDGFQPLSNFDSLYQQKVLLEIAKGNVPNDAFYLDDLQMQMDLITERAQDQAIGTYSQWEKEAFREVLDSFNLTQLPSTVANQIYQMAGG